MVELMHERERRRLEDLYIDHSVGGYVHMVLYRHEVEGVGYYLHGEDGAASRQPMRYGQPAPGGRPGPYTPWRWSHGGVVQGSRRCTRRTVLSPDAGSAVDG